MDDVETNMDRVNEELSHSDTMIKNGEQKLAELPHEATVMSNEVNCHFTLLLDMLIPNRNARIQIK